MGRSCRRIAPSSAITFELLGQMLGVRRTTVTMAAQLLQSAGLIRYRRGLIQIVDRPALEDIACECYAVVRHNADKIFARPSPSAKPTDKWSMGDNSERTERLQFMLSADELAEIEKFRFEAMEVLRTQQHGRVDKSAATILLPN
jgi:DNA-binding transcriptional MocR family regulator